MASLEEKEGQDLPQGVTLPLLPPTASPRETLGADELLTQLAQSIAERDARSGFASIRLGASREMDLVLGELIAEGGMGRVHLARQQSLQREVAVKLSHEDAGARGALVKEAEILGSLEHPNILPVHLLASTGEGAAALVMKRIEGVSWEEILCNPTHPARVDNPLFDRDELSAHLEILMQVSNALQFAHSRGVIHRDIKPSNVMLGPFGEVYLIDWGVAYRHGKASESGDIQPIVGSPSHMSPEQVSGRIPDARTDVYLLGATLYQILTGKPLHDGATVIKALRQACASEPPAFSDEVPKELAALCIRATRKDPAERPPSALEFQREIRAFLRHRASITLVQEASHRLGELVALTRSKDPDLAEIARMASECRYGFRQALREWDANDEAAEGLQRVLVALCHFELGRENVTGARSLLLEMTTPDKECAARVEALEAAIREREEALERERRRAREMDARVGARQRAALVLGPTAVIVGIVIYLLYHPYSTATLLQNQTRLLVFQLAVCLVLGVPFLALRRTLLRNKSGRWFGTVTMAFCFAVLVNRLLTVGTEASASMILQVDALISGSVMLAAGLTHYPPLLPAAVFYFVGAVGIWLVPAQAGWIYRLTTGAGLVVFAWILWRLSREAREISG